MGLAASQARFLCITARKADCEYKSTELAQEKLEITNQLSDISNEYSNAMNATKLVWSNDVMDTDYGLTYSLLMTPSAANDYNPYMITTTSGAVVLNSEYAMAAKAAGISKAGGVGSQASRDKFIQALVPSGIVTQDSANEITINDYKASINSDNEIEFADSVTAGTGVNWDADAGVGGEILNKSTVESMDLSGLATSDAIGKQLIDWGQLIVGDNQITEVEYNRTLSNMNAMETSIAKNNITDAIINQLNTDLKDLNEQKSTYENDNGTKKSGLTTAQETKYQKLSDQYTSLSKLKSAAEQIRSNSNADVSSLGFNSASDVYTSIRSQIQADITAYKNKYKPTTTSGGTTTTTINTISIGSNDGGVFNTKDTNLDSAKYSIVVNGIINHYTSELNEMNIGDLLTGNVVLMSSDKSAKSEKDFQEKVKKLFDSIVEVFGYSSDGTVTGIGLNIDESSSKALAFAYKMMQRVFNDSYKVESGSRTNTKSMTDNSAYIYADSYNGFASDEKKDSGYKGVSLSNLVSMFLTYYDNGLNGADSSYVVGATQETSTYVTDNSGYYYLIQADENAAKTATQKSADFFDQLYNNICEHGWREDDSIEDSEYLESAIKDGRYSMMSLNSKDGYYYQTRYNETGYIVEETDSDAIARAEAEFTSKKTELTYKEDKIDLKTKQLDAEISSLSTEYDTVKNLISTSISKTFSLFQN